MTRSRNRVLLVILSATLCGIMGNTLIAPALPDIVDDFGVGDGAAGLLIAATSLPGIFLAPVIGIMADRYGRRNLLVPCLAIFGVGGLSAAAAPTFEALVAARFVMGIGAAGLINLAIVLIGDNWSGEDRVRLLGRNSAFLTACIALLPPLGGIMTDLWGWRIALLPYGLAIPFAINAWRTLDGSRPGTVVTLREQLRAAGSVLKRPEVIVVLIGAATVFVLIYGAFLAALPLHLEQEFGYTASVRGLFLAVPAIPSTVSAFNLQRLSARFGGRRLLVGSGVLLSVGFLFIGSADVVWLLILGGVLYGFGEGVMIPGLQNVIVATTTADVRGAVMAAYVSVTRLGQTIGPLGAAAIFEATSTDVALQVGALLAGGLTLLFVFAPIGRRASRPLETTSSS